MTSKNPANKDHSKQNADSKSTDQTQTSKNLFSDTHASKGDIPPAPGGYQITCKTEKDWRDKIKFWAELVGLAVLVAYTIFTGLMYCANKKSADAAKSAADTAKEALHISQRAYIMNEAPELDIVKKAINILFVNTGHIPSGEVEIVIHEATSNSIGTVPVPLSAAVERHWKRFKLPFISPAHPFGLLIPIPRMDLEKLNTGHQKIEVVGFIRYNDGFPPNTNRELWLFCEETVYHLVVKRIMMVPCDASSHLPAFESLDGYPNNEQQ